MDQRLSAPIHILVSIAARAWTSLASSFAVDAKNYRPEKYYMRGAGPKWREKHEQGSARR
jgi:hypothetical protein